MPIRGGNPEKYCVCLTNRNIRNTVYSSQQLCVKIICDLTPPSHHTCNTPDVAIGKEIVNPVSCMQQIVCSTHSIYTYTRVCASARVQLLPPLLILGSHLSPISFSTIILRPHTWSSLGMLTVGRGGEQLRRPRRQNESSETAGRQPGRIEFFAPRPRTSALTQITSNCVDRVVKEPSPRSKS